MNPNQTPLHHHHHRQPQGQHLYQQSHTGTGSPGNPDNVLVYINNNHGSGGDAGAEGPSNSGGSMAVHNGPMPPVAWVKSHPSSQQHLSSSSTGTGNGLPCLAMNVNNNSCSSTCSSSSAYGAPSSYSQQSFYSEPNPANHHHRYSNESSVSALASTNSSYQSRTGAGSSFYPSDPTSTSADYYHHDTQFNSAHSENGACISEESNSSNFYRNGNEISSGFYPQNNHNYHTANPGQEYPGEYSRLHYNNPHNQSSSSCNYFNSPSNRSASSCSSYGHQQASGPDFQHHSSQIPPFRRNSIESFSTEPGDLSYNTKYGSYNSNHFSSPHVKREALTPSTSPWSGEHDSSQGYFFNNSGNSNGNSSHAQPHPNRNHYNSSVCHNNAPNSPHGHPHHCDSPNPLHHSQTPSTFSKSSCAFEGSGQPTMSSGQPDGGQYKASPVKHRSLSYSGRSINFDQPFHHSTGSSAYLAHTEGPGNVNKCVPAAEGRNGSSPNLLSEDAVDSYGTNLSLDDENGPECTSSPGQMSLDHVDDGKDSCSSQSNLDGLEVPCDIEPTDSVSDLEQELKKEIESVSTSGPDERPDDPSTTVKVENDEEISNSSLFDAISLNHFGSPAASEPQEEDLQVGDEDEDSLSGISSFSSHHILHPRSSCDDRSASVSPSPQKISKRSFSEADKDLVINTSAIRALTGRGRKVPIPVPRGWKREVSSGHTSPLVFYVSPSDTKLRSLDEVKNYLTSDGTCKCGLSCPLRLEHAFSFDPKVSNSSQEKEESLLNLGESGRPCCNHKRKVPISEDSPLISSTRDDLGDYGEPDVEIGSKKRRITESPGEGVNRSDEERGPGIPNPPSSPSSHSHNVPVPFSQQSPDTTTQTPQRDMSPASSVSSEASSGGPGRSTPAPLKSSPATVTSPPAKGSNQSEFAWPTPPSGLQLVRPQTPPGAPGFWTSPNITISPGKKPPQQPYQHHLMPKGAGKRANSPCPNVDVRQMPGDSVRPPPRPATTSSLKPTPPPPVISITPTGASQNSGLSLFPIIPGAGTPGEPTNYTNLNTGYSISPILPNSGFQGLSSANTLQFANIMPIQTFCSQAMPRLVTTSTAQPAVNPNMLIQQSLPSSITISMVGQGLQNQHLANIAPSPAPAILLPKLIPRTTSGSSSNTTDSVVDDKSPLQLVQDVVDRVHTAKPTTGDIEVVIESSTVKKEPTSETAAETKPVTTQVPPATQTSCAEPAKELAPQVFKSESIPNIVSLFSSPSITIHPLQANSSVTTTAATSNVPIMTSCPLVNCGNTPSQINVATSTPGLSITTMSNNGSSLILQDQNRYPIFQTIQPFFLNSGGAGGSLIISPHQAGGGEAQQQSFIHIDPSSGCSNTGAGAEMATVVLDPNSGLLCGGPKKKKKRLSKKQQQQQAQLQLQQQLLLQQLHQQVQQQQQVQQAQQQLPLLFPQSFNLGGSGFSLQPMNMNMNMNFFPTPTILTLPNLILNPADGTLFIQQQQQLSSTATSCAPTVKFSGQFPNVSVPNLIAPKKEAVPVLTAEVISSDDSSRQNATPDSSTNDCTLGLMAPSTPQPTPITVTLPLGSSNNLQAKKPLKSKIVSSSTATHKRILPQQKQILPKIDSTTPSTENP